jgi:hypothetical protein
VADDPTAAQVAVVAVQVAAVAVQVGVAVAVPVEVALVPADQDVMTVVVAAETIVVDEVVPMDGVDATVFEIRVAARVAATSSHRSGVRGSTSPRPMRSVVLRRSTRSAADPVLLVTPNPTSVGLTSASPRSGSTKVRFVRLPRALQSGPLPLLEYVGK